MLGGQRKLHWRDENSNRRWLITQTIIGCDVVTSFIVVVRSGLPTESKTGPRKATFSRLLTELDSRSVATARFESRGPADDKRDRDTHENLRRGRRISNLHVEHRLGASDPGLWIADAVCGAVTAARTGEPRYLDALRPKLTLITINWDDN